MKTSTSYPLRIDWVHIDEGKRNIGITFCPGKKQKHAMTGSLDRDLETDISIIKSSGSSALATLMEELELNYYGVPKAHIEAITKSHGLDWFFLPIKDAGIPTLAFVQ
jgi:hypothetical protein